MTYLVALITSFATRLYGQMRGQHKTLQREEIELVRCELDRSKAQYDANPDTLQSWSEVEAKILATTR